MPEITRFYGIIIKIFFRNEHNPPHIHAIYGEHNGLFSIKDMQMIEGDLPARAVKLVQEWGKPLSVAHGAARLPDRRQTGSGVGQTIVRGASKNVGHKTTEKTSSTEIVSSPMIKGDDAHAVN